MTCSFNWPPISYDLMHSDYFLWGYVKAHAYTNKPVSIDAFDDNIEAFIHEIPAEMLERVCQKTMPFETKLRSTFA